jgi:hypothetical protein
MASRRVEHQPARPFLELHLGGVHVIVERVPYRLLTMISTAAGALGGVFWFGGR